MGLKILGALVNGEYLETEKIIKLELESSCRNSFEIICADDECGEKLTTKLCKDKMHHISHVNSDHDGTCKNRGAAPETEEHKKVKEIFANLEPKNLNFQFSVIPKCGFPRHTSYVRPVCNSASDFGVVKILKEKTVEFNEAWNPISQLLPKRYVPDCIGVDAMGIVTIVIEICKSHYIGNTKGCAISQFVPVLEFDSNSIVRSFVENSKNLFSVSQFWLPPTHKLETIHKSLACKTCKYLDYFEKDKLSSCLGLKKICYDYDNEKFNYFSDHEIMKSCACCDKQLTFNSGFHNKVRVCCSFCQCEYVILESIRNEIDTQHLLTHSQIKELNFTGVLKRGRYPTLRRKIENSKPEDFALFRSYLQFSSSLEDKLQCVRLLLGRGYLSENIKQKIAIFIKHNVAHENDVLAIKTYNEISEERMQLRQMQMKLEEEKNSIGEETRKHQISEDETDEEQELEDDNNGEEDDTDEEQELEDDTDEEQELEDENNGERELEEGEKIDEKRRLAEKKFNEYQCEMQKSEKRRDAEKKFNEYREMQESKEVRLCERIAKKRRIDIITEGIEWNEKYYFKTSK